jgi:hypothetical protein
MEKIAQKRSAEEGRDINAPNRKLGGKRRKNE